MVREHGHLLDRFQDYILERTVDYPSVIPFLMEQQGKVSFRLACKEMLNHSNFSSWPVSINGTKSRVKLRAWDAGRDLVHSLRPDRLTGELQIDSAIARHWTGVALLGRSDVRRSWRPRWGYDSNGAKSNAKACWCCWTWNDQASVRLEGFVEMIGLCPPRVGVLR